MQECGHVLVPLVFGKVHSQLLIESVQHSLSDMTTRSQHENGRTILPPPSPTPTSGPLKIYHLGWRILRGGTHFWPWLHFFFRPLCFDLFTFLTPPIIFFQHIHVCFVFLFCCFCFVFFFFCVICTMLPRWLIFLSFLFFFFFITGHPSVYRNKECEEVKYSTQLFYCN